MNKKSYRKWMWSFAMALSLGIAGCNLFHPTDSRDAESDDPEALTLDGYIEFQNSNFDSARRFFNRALDADSGHSEAWIGLAKCVLSTREGLNAFELVSYAQSKEDENGKNTNELLSMPEEKATVISDGIDSVMHYLNMFIARDTTDRTDKKIRFNDIADSYTILQLTKAALRIRAVQTQLASVVSTDNSGMMMNLTTLTDLGDSLKPFLKELASAAEAIKTSPEATSEIIKAVLPDSTRQYINDDDYANVTVGLANTVIQLNDRAQTTPDDRYDVFFKFANIMDDDGDGCVDEEILDNFDNDGDGEIDEDVRDNRVVVLVKNTLFIKDDDNKSIKLNENSNKIYDLSKSQVDSLNIIEKYETVDIDMNGKMGTKDYNEWHYIYRDPDERDSNQNHQLKFAEALDFEFAAKSRFPEKMTSQDSSKVKQLIKNKELIRKDSIYDPSKKLPKYNLKKRQEMVGGCWNNYTEEDFKLWFQWRNAK